MLWNEIIWVKEDILAAIVIINNENVNKEGGSPFVMPRRDFGGTGWSTGVLE
jgi:hypothetical protein